MSFIKCFIAILLVGACIFAADSTSTQPTTAGVQFKMTTGTLLALDTVRQVIIVNGRNKVDTISLDSKTVFSHFSTPINESSLKVNDNLIVHYRVQSGSKTAIRVVQKAGTSTTAQNSTVGQ